MRDHWDNGAGIASGQSGIEVVRHADKALDGRFFTIYDSRFMISTFMKTMHTFAPHKGLVLPGTALVPSGFPGGRIVAAARMHRGEL
jgi:hypothetical protein